LDKAIAFKSSITNMLICGAYCRTRRTPQINKLIISVWAIQYKRRL